jgi:glutamyl-tRNA reductase/hydroxymethylbilane synthase
MSIDLREQLALSAHRMPAALEALQQAFVSHNITEQGHAYEGVIVSTCNRLEVYAALENAARGITAIESFITAFNNVDIDQIRPLLYRRQERQAVNHLFRLACGLDSMILGEGQILSQVTDASVQATQAGASGPVLTQLFNRAVHTGKRARTETGINRHSTSIGHVAALLVKRQIGDLTGARILIVGAGTMAALAAQALQCHGAQTLMCINRTYARAADIATRIAGQAWPWERLQYALMWADVVVTTTSAEQPIITVEDVQSLLPYRTGRVLTLVDIAVPRNIAYGIEQLEGVTRFDVDDLHSVIDDNLTQRRAEIPHVESIIADELEHYMHWLSSRAVVPVIAEFRQKVSALAQIELAHALPKLALNTSHYEAITRLVERITNKLLHEPTVRLKAHAANGVGVAYAQVITDLFALDDCAEVTIPASNGKGRSAHPSAARIQRYQQHRVEQVDQHIVRIGTRGSTLARWQAEYTREQLQQLWPRLRPELRIIETRGDRILDTPLPLVGGKGLFTAELEAELRNGSLDIAVHSLKDVPTEQPDGLVLGAIPRRVDPSDVLLSRRWHTLDTLPIGATVGTSSRRRAAQLLHHRPDLNIIDIRGNLETRINKAFDASSPYDAIILALAGLERLGLTKHISQMLPPDVMLAAPGQGALAVQCRDEAEMLTLLAPFNDPDTSCAVCAERAFLAGLGGSCAIPIAAYATIHGNRLTLRGRVSAQNGLNQIDVQTNIDLPDEHDCRLSSAEQVGADLAHTAIERGAIEILEIVL